MSAIRDVLASILLLGGVFFSLVAAIGIVRLPDVYSRIHASSKSTTLGLAGLLGDRLRAALTRLQREVAAGLRQHEVVERLAVIHVELPRGERPPAAPPDVPDDVGFAA